MELTRLTDRQRLHRQAIRAAFLVATVGEMRQEMKRQDDFGRLVLRDMIDTCVRQGVDNFGDTTGEG